MDRSEAALPEVLTNRMDDAAYRGALETNRLHQQRQVAARQEVVDKMQRMIAEVRASLPADADEEAVKSALEQREEWRALESENASRLAQLEKTLTEARATVRQRLLQEQRDVKAVAEGRARPGTVDAGRPRQ